MSDNSFKYINFQVAWQVLRLQLHQSHNAMKQPNAGARLSLSVFAFFQCYLMLSLFSSLILISSISLHHTETDNPIDLLINGVRSGRYRFVVTSNKNWFFDLINNSSKLLKVMLVLLKVCFRKLSLHRDTQKTRNKWLHFFKII